MKVFNRLAKISGAVVRLTIGIGGAALVFLALKDKVRLGASKKLQK